MPNDTARTPTTPWLALRLAAGISQREAERRLGWAGDGGGHGRLSLIERGVAPDDEQARQLRELYGALLTSGPRA